MRRATLLACLLALVAAAAAATPAAAKPTLRKAFWGPVRIDGHSQFPTYKRLGVDVFQMQLRWDLAAARRPKVARDPRDPAYHWPADVDDAIAQARRYHMQVLLMIKGTPGWANGHRSKSYPPSNPFSYANFAIAAARRYKSVHLWMIWGEPTRRPNWATIPTIQVDGPPLTRAQTTEPRRYARLLDTAYGVLKRRSRRNLVIGGNTFTWGDMPARRWARAMRLRNGKPPRMDLWGHNAFSSRLPDLRNPHSPYEAVDFSDLGRFQRSIDAWFARPRGKRHIRFWLSEFTMPTKDDPNATVCNDTEFPFCATRQGQAMVINAAFRVARQVHAYGLGWIHLRDGAPRPGGGRRSHGGLEDWNGRRKPGFWAFARNR